MSNPIAGTWSITVPGSTLITLPVTPTCRWHPGFSTVVASGGRVVSATDLQGLADLTEGAPGIGPLIVTDGLGRLCWRFTGAEFLNVAAGLVANQRNISLFLVCRAHAAGNINFFGQGNVMQGTTQNTAAALMNTAVTNNIAPYLRGCGRGANLDATNKAKIVVGSQMQVLGVVSRTGDQRLYVNNNVASVPATSTNAAAVVGAEFGRYPFSPGASGTWAFYDCYEALIVIGQLSDAQADAMMDSLVTGWAIQDITGQIILAGDSITIGTGLASYQTMGILLTAPGVQRTVPPWYRVVNIGVSGETIAGLAAKRDATDSIFSALLPGPNRIMAQIGRNDLTASAGSGTTALNAYVSLLHTTSVGLLERGFDVKIGVNISSGSGLDAAMQVLRTGLRSSQFKIDTLSDPGNTYAGKVTLFELPGITSGSSGTIFDTAADAADLTWYQSGLTHPSAAGEIAMVFGADTPENGYAANAT